MSHIQSDIIKSQAFNADMELLKDVIKIDIRRQYKIGNKKTATRLSAYFLC